MSVVAVDDGFDFHVVVLDDTWVVRVPRRQACADALAVEAALLPALAPALPVQVPQFEHAHPFAIYRVIDGTPLVDEEDGVREFLEALHDFDVGELPVPRPDWLETYRAQCDEFRRLVLPALDVDERARAEALFAEVETIGGFEPVLTHSDLGPEHLLCRTARRRDRLGRHPRRRSRARLFVAPQRAVPALGGRRRPATACALLPPAQGRRTMTTLRATDVRPSPRVNVTVTWSLPGRANRLVSRTSNVSS